MTTSKKTLRYNVTIEGSDWGHFIMSYSSKKTAIKRAGEVKRWGCLFSDDLKKYDVEHAVILVYDNSINQDVAVYNFTKKYISAFKN